MGVYIKGIETPKSCRKCRFSGFGGIKGELNVCIFTGQSQPTLSPERMSKCPLVPAPPHGRLIDADALIKEHGMLLPRDGGYMPIVYLSYVSNAPTIIPADPAEEGER